MCSRTRTPMSRTHPSVHRHTNRYPFAVASRSPRRLVAVSSVLHRHARSVCPCLPRPAPPSTPAPAVPGSATAPLLRPLPFPARRLLVSRTGLPRGPAISRHTRMRHAFTWHLGAGSSRTRDGVSRQARHALRASFSVRGSHAGQRFPAMPARATRWYLGAGSSRTRDGISRQISHALRASVSARDSHAGRRFPATPARARPTFLYARPKTPRM